MEDACKISESKHIIELKKITPKLQAALRFANIFETGPHDHSWREIDTGGKGQIFFKTIFWQPEIAICDNVCAAGSSYPPHQHKGREIFIVYQGEIVFTHDGKTVKIKDKPYYFDSVYKHSGYCETNSRFIAITMPGDLDWRPSERRHKRDF